MKKIALVLILISGVFAATPKADAKSTAKSTAQAESKSTNLTTNAGNPRYGEGFVFVGPELNLGGLYQYGGFTMAVGANAGYQHYFKQEWQFAGFRHGVRGWGNLAYRLNTYGYGGYNYTYHGFHLRAGADWTLEFNPRDSVVWGVYTGLSLGYNYYSADSDSYYSIGGFAGAWHIGGSVNIDTNHRFDVGLEVGTFSILTLRYLYMF